MAVKELAFQSDARAGLLAGVEKLAAAELIPALEKAFKEQSKPSLVIVPVDYDENMKLTKRLGEIIAS